jgi:hypothetical protein
LYVNTNENNAVFVVIVSSTHCCVLLVKKPLIHQHALTFKKVYGGTEIMLKYKNGLI